MQPFLLLGRAWSLEPPALHVRMLAYMYVCVSRISLVAVEVGRGSWTP